MYMTETWTSREDFIGGLVAQGGTPEMEDYVYAGGDSGSKLDYFLKRFIGQRVNPVEKRECVCGHKIVENCYIQHKITKCIYVVGNQCIKRFMHKIQRTCSICATVHKNRKDNLCNDCRNSVVFIKVEYVQKEDAKKLGARWNPILKLWWVHPSNTAAIEEFGRYI